MDKMTKANKHTKKNSFPEFEKILETLEDGKSTLTEEEIRSLTDLAEDRANAFHKIWDKVDDERKMLNMRAMLSAAHKDILLDYTAIVRTDLLSANPAIRRIALHLMQDLRTSWFLEEVIRITQTDTDPEIKKDAIEILGFFLDDLISQKHQQLKLERARRALLKLVNAEQQDICFCAMEALAYLDEEVIHPLIRLCFTSHDPQTLASGLRAVQRSMRAEWQQDVRENLDHEDPTVRIEAIRAAGALQMKSALDNILLLLTQFDRIDQETLDAAILAASQIGGEEASEMISLLEEVLESDEESIELFEQAKANLELLEFESQLYKKESSADVSSDESEYDQNDFYYLDLLRDRIAEMSDYATSDDDDDDDEEEEEFDSRQLDDLAAPDDEIDLDDEEDEYEERHLHHLGGHHPFKKIEDIDWSRYRIIENWEDEDEIHDQHKSPLDDMADDFLKKKRKK